MSVSRIGFIAAGAASTVALLPTTALAAAGSGATILALYKKPADKAAFDAYYTNHHAPLAKTLPGLQTYMLSKSLADSDPYYLVATLTFPSLDSLKAALASKTGAAVVADLKNFAQAGVDIMTFENVPA